MKTISLLLDEKLLKAIDRHAKALGCSRAAFIRKACEEFIRKLKEEELERQYVEGYRSKPEDPVWGEIGSRLAAEVWPREDWAEWDEKR
jgi:hypothetical protein